MSGVGPHGMDTTVDLRSPVAKQRKTGPSEALASPAHVTPAGASSALASPVAPVSTGLRARHALGFLSPEDKLASDLAGSTPTAEAPAGGERVFSTPRPRKSRRGDVIGSAKRNLHAMFSPWRSHGEEESLREQVEDQRGPAAEQQPALVQEPRGDDQEEEEEEQQQEQQEKGEEEDRMEGVEEPHEDADAHVSDEALQGKDKASMCVVEVLIKRGRTRTGVAALRSWSISDLKRRLVYLHLFEDAGAVDLMPRFASDPLPDETTLSDMDFDITYEAQATA